MFGQEQFPGEDIVNIVKLVINEVFQEVQSGSETEMLTEHWISLVEEKVLWNLSKMNKPFKFIVTCAILQKNGAGFHSASACYWDDNTDGSCTVRWENAFMCCIVTVFGLAV
ncbi:dynein light chain Tctex-type 1-like [Argiope bruennichi]|uniref:dynein light chain Tctex-type 1-like n=1 Tax=Argiope bruennichi TaxID=94029 RepID=UPI00249586C7|nr:dynein light chain Tctex-type 1-like [Argiope bruennichi]